jgi:hypothetical protein
MKFAYATIRNFGLISIDINNINRPILANTLYTRGGEGIAILKNQKYLIMTDGFIGLTSSFYLFILFLFFFFFIFFFF